MLQSQAWAAFPNWQVAGDELVWCDGCSVCLLPWWISWAFHVRLWKETFALWNWVLRPPSPFCSRVSSNYFSLSYICRSNSKDIGRAFGPHQMLHVLILEWDRSSQKKKINKIQELVLKLPWNFHDCCLYACCWVFLTISIRVSSVLKPVFCQRCSKCSVNECKELISCLLQTGKAPSNPRAIKRQ